MAEENKQYHTWRHFDREMTPTHFDNYARVMYSDTNMWRTHDQDIILMMGYGWPHNESFYKRTQHWGYRNTRIMLVVQWPQYRPNESGPGTRAAIEALTDTSTYLGLDYDSDGGTSFESNSDYK